MVVHAGSTAHGRWRWVCVVHHSARWEAAANQNLQLGPVLGALMGGGGMGGGWMGGGANQAITPEHIGQALGDNQVLSMAQ